MTYGILWKMEIHKKYHSNTQISIGVYVISATEMQRTLSDEKL
jgi:hypothetical protein